MVINDNLVASLEKQLADVNKRMDRLAGLRARYSNLASEVHNRTETVERAHAALAEAAASQSAAKTASLLTRLDRPETGERPLGPSRAVIALGGTFCGFAAGLGLMFLAMPIGGRLQGRRWSDYVHFGRRATDRASGRRAEDQTKPPTNEEVIYARRAEDVSVGRRTEDKTGGRGENRPLNLFGDNSTQNPFPQDVNPPAAPKP
jgi:hypothetical protein